MIFKPEKNKLSRRKQFIEYLISAIFNICLEMNTFMHLKANLFKGLILLLRLATVPYFAMVQQTPQRGGLTRTVILSLSFLSKGYF